MLANIKSVYFIKLVFSKIDEKRKLNIVKYNKSLQNILSIKLVNYIFISNKYIVYEENGIGKEYDCSNDELLYIGQYKNGERNGKGKEYYNNKVVFEGEYLNGKRNGKGIKYDIDKRKVLFEGQYLNGKRWNGIQKKFNENSLYFEGEYLNGKLWNCKYSLYDEVYKLEQGKGFFCDYDKENIYIGEYLNGERNGKGKEYWKGNLIFEGEYLNGKRNGKGKEYFDDKLEFEGEYLNGKRKGKGKDYYYDGTLSFEGKYLDNERWKGILYDFNGNIIYELNKENNIVKEYY